MEVKATLYYSFAQPYIHCLQLHYVQNCLLKLSTSSAWSFAVHWVVKVAMFTLIPLSHSEVHWGLLHLVFVNATNIPLWTVMAHSHDLDTPHAYPYHPPPPLQCPPLWPLEHDYYHSPVPTVIRAVLGWMIGNLITWMLTVHWMWDTYKCHTFNL